MTAVTSANPATGTARDLDVDESTPQEVRRLCAAAGIAARDYAARPLAWRADLLGAMADELEADAASLVTTAAEETALTTPRLEGELRRTAFQLRFFADVVADGAFLVASIDHATDSPMGPLPDLRRWRTPLGPVAVFGSSNFPFAFSVPGGDTASALAAGCPVVIKAHPAHPATSLGCFAALARAATAAGAPDGLLGLVFGLDAGVALVDDPAIRAVGFTGSVAAGHALWRRANDRPVPIPFYGELGSANPLVVSAAAAAERAREIAVGAAGSMTLGAGQFCTKPGLLFVPTGPAGDELVSGLVAALGEVPPMTMLTSGIADHFRSGADSLARTPGSRPLVPVGDGGGTTVGPGLFEVAAVTFAQDPWAALRHETFGPAAVVVRYSDADDLRRALERADAALTFSVFLGDSDPDGPWLVEHGAARAGRVVVNGFPTGVGVSWSMQHGGPWPATTSGAATSVGAGSIDRWLRPVTYQNVPDDLLPEALRDVNPLELPRRVDGERS